MPSRENMIRLPDFDLTPGLKEINNHGINAAKYNGEEVIIGIGDVLDRVPQTFGGL
jgi:hypothetical protein